MVHCTGTNTELPPAEGAQGFASNVYKEDSWWDEKEESKISPSHAPLKCIVWIYDAETKLIKVSFIISRTKRFA